MEYKVSIVIDDNGVKTDKDISNDQLYIALMGIEQLILDKSDDKQKAYEDICIITEGVLFDETD